MTDKIWTYVPLIDEHDYDPDVNPDLNTILEEPVREGWKLVQMRADLYAIWSAAMDKNEKLVTDILAALTDPAATKVSLHVDRASLTVEGDLLPIV